MVPKEACQGVVAAVFLAAVAVAVAIAIVALGHQVEAQMLVEEKSTANLWGAGHDLVQCKGHGQNQCPEPNPGRGPGHLGTRVEVLEVGVGVTVHLALVQLRQKVDRVRD